MPVEPTARIFSSLISVSVRCGDAWFISSACVGKFTVFPPCGNGSHSAPKLVINSELNIKMEAVMWLLASVYIFKHPLEQIINKHSLSLICDSTFIRSCISLFVYLCVPFCAKSIWNLDANFHRLIPINLCCSDLTCWMNHFHWIFICLVKLQF